MKLFLAARADETRYLIIFNETQELVLYMNYSRVFGLLVFIASYRIKTLTFHS